MFMIGAVIAPVGGAAIDGIRARTDGLHSTAKGSKYRWELPGQNQQAGS